MQVTKNFVALCNAKLYLG